MRMQIAVGALLASSCAVSRGRTGKHKNIRQTRAKTRRPGQRDRHMEFEPFCWTRSRTFSGGRSGLGQDHLDESGGRPGEQCPDDRVQRLDSNQHESEPRADTPILLFLYSNFGDRSHARPRCVDYFPCASRGSWQ